MPEKNPTVIAIAGLDPSGGAGILADFQTLTAMGVQAHAVCTAMTVQHDLAFEDIRWTSPDFLAKQLTSMVNRFEPQVVKIGITESQESLLTLLQILHRHCPSCAVIWDPVLCASTGFAFWKKWNDDLLADILQYVTLLTPNLQEASLLTRAEDPEEGALHLSRYCAVLLKGGHGNASSVHDILFSNGMKEIFTHDRLASGEKHGSGCVLSSAIAAGMAKGESLQDAIRNAGNYIRKFLSSSPTRMGKHQPV